MLDRRSFLAAGGAAAALAALGLPTEALAANGLQLSQPTPFSFDALLAQAKALAAKPYVAAVPLAPEVLERIDYDAHGKIKFDPANALFRDGPGAFPVTFFHLGRFFQTPVRMHVLENTDGDAFSREVLYNASYFSMPPDSPARALPPGAGFAGFRLQESRLGDQSKLDWQKNDWVAFLGASYFRAIGELYQYGLSARGVALDVAVPDKAEEFPTFTRFYFETPAANNTTSMTVYALLEGPSVTGVFKFVMQRNKAVIMDIDARMFLRRDVSRLGLVPLTSMYWYSETIKPTAIDWRPEVHDSDGLAIWNGAGERIWRPLNNPMQTRASAFADTRPRGFGLLQRDRAFDHYQDGVNYEKRPACGSNRWVTGARARCSSSRFRPTTRFTTTSSPSGCPRRMPRPARATACNTDCTGATRSRFRHRSRGAWPRASAAAGSRGSRVRRACASSWSSSSVSRWRPCPSA
jgi:glucans biosynthesis protein